MRRHRALPPRPLTSIALALILAALAGGCPGPKPAVIDRPPGQDDPAAVDLASDPVASAEPDVPLWSRIRKGVLPSGLTYYILPHGKPEQRAAMWLAVNTGSVQEDDDQRGLAHFVEHMAFNGTTHFAHMAIVDYLEKIGMRFGPDVNAYTSFDQTVYQLQVPTDDATYVNTGLDILRDWAGEISFDADEVEKERGVVLEEWRLGRGARARVFDKQAAVLFAGSRYAERLTIGKPEILRTAPRDALVRYYRDWYRPDLMAVIVVGDVDADDIEREITTRFADLAGPAQPRPRPRGEVPRADGTRVSIETDPELASTSVSVYNTFAYQAERTGADFRRLVASNLYQLLLNARFAEVAERPGAPLLGAGSSISSLTREIDAFTRGAQVKDGRVEDALATLIAEVLRVERHGFTAAELARGKASLLRSARQSAREIDKHDGSELADEITRNFFEGELMPGRSVEAELTEADLAEITLDELNALARAWGGDDNRAILITAPATITLPSKARVLAVVAEVTAQELEPWQDQLDGKTLLDVAPTPGTITGKRTLPDGAGHPDGVLEWTLSNGARVVIKPTDFENDTVSLDAFSPGGTALATDKAFPSARFADAVIGAGGAGAHSARDLRKLLAGTVASVDTWIGETEEGLNGRASAEDLETLLQLTYLRMTAPRRDDEAFAVWKQGMLDWVSHRQVIPEVAFYDEVGKVLSGDHARRRPTEASDLEHIDLDAALAFYRERFADAGDFTFVFVGNIDPATLAPLVETYLASLPGTGHAERERDIGVKRPKGVQKRVVTRGREPKSSVYLTFHGKQAFSRDGARDIGILAEVLRVRLREILREDLGGVYGVGVWGDLGRAPREERTFSIQFGCAPENVTKLEDAVFAEIARLQKSGIDPAYLDKLRESRKRDFETNLRDNGAWSEWLTRSYRHGDALADLLDLDAGLARLTSDRVRAAAKKYLDKKQYVLGVLEPEVETPATPNADPPAP